MNGFSLDKVVTLISLALAIGASINAYLNRRDAATEKQYAASREFGHIKNSLLNITNTQVSLSDEIDRRFDTVAKEQAEIKALLFAVMGRGPKKEE